MIGTKFRALGIASLLGLLVSAPAHAGYVLEKIGPGVQPSVSADGRYVAYTCYDGTGFSTGLDICVYDRVTETRERFDLGPLDSNPAISADGRYVAFIRTVSQFDSSGRGALLDRVTGNMEVVVENVRNFARGSATPAINADGTLIAYRGAGTGEYTRLFNRLTGSLEVLFDGYPGSFSADGRYLAMVADGTGKVYDLSTGVVDPITYFVPALGIWNDTGFDALGDVQRPSLSGDGAIFAVGSYYIQRATGESYSVVDWNLDAGENAVISANGARVAFRTRARLVKDDLDSYKDVYVFHTASGLTQRVGGSSGKHTCSPGWWNSQQPVVSADGLHVAYDSAVGFFGLEGRSNVYVATDDAGAHTCGDGIVSIGYETCEDGNAIDGDGCDSNCRTTGCGNGVVTSGEVCDDGNDEDRDACKNDCQPNVCGDGVIFDGTEECDDGNLVDGDGCSSTCKSELIPGGGKKSLDCLSEWRTEPTTPLDRKGVPSRTLRCKDDDPSCDFGAATGDGTCTFHVGLCLGVEDLRRRERDGSPSCKPQSVERIEMRKPNPLKPRDAVETANRDALEAVLQGIGGQIGPTCLAPAFSKGLPCQVNEDCDEDVADGRCGGRVAHFAGPTLGTCTDFASVRVPLKAPGVKGTTVLKLNGALYDRCSEKIGLDRNKLKLECLP